MNDSTTAVVVVVVGVVVLGVAWLLYLAHGGKPVRIIIKGMGIEVDIARPNDSRNQKCRRRRTSPMWAVDVPTA